MTHRRKILTATENALRLIEANQDLTQAAILSG
jgi:hypothetical protein